MSDVMVGVLALLGALAVVNVLLVLFTEVILPLVILAALVLFFLYPHVVRETFADIGRMVRKK